MTSLLAAAALVAFAQESPVDTPVVVPTPTAVNAEVTAIDTLLGKGPTVAEGDVVTVLYKGWLPTTGVVFDESKDKPPFAFKVGGTDVVPGFGRAVIGMSMGGKRTAFIPAALGYGDNGADKIPPKSNLIMEIELLRIDREKAEPKIDIESQAPGTGPEAKAGDVVELHYTGTFLNGRKFDSSRDRNQTLSFELGAKRVIEGFDQGVIGMRAGGKRRVTIPYTMAYGAEGRPPIIPKFSTLVFEIELVRIR